MFTSMSGVLERERESKMSEELYLIRAKHPAIAKSTTDFANYIATREEFKQYAGEIFDIFEDCQSNALFRDYVRYFQRVRLIDESYEEDRAGQGIERVVATGKGDIKIGYTRIRENRIYVECGGRFYRGIKTFFADLCLVGAMDFVPLDKSRGDGNIEILMWNKRKATKGIRFIHNKIQSVLYVVDMEFGSEEEMQADLNDPKELNLGLIIGPLLNVKEEGH